MAFIKRSHETLRKQLPSRLSSKSLFAVCSECRFHALAEVGLAAFTLLIGPSISSYKRNPAEK